MPDVFASSTDIVLDALTSLTSNYLGFLAVSTLVLFGFIFFWKVVYRGKGVVK